MATLEELRAKKTQTAVQGPQQSALQKLRATQPAKVPAQTPFEKSGVVDVTKVQSDIQKVLKGVTLPQQDSVGTKTAKAVFGAPKKLFDTVTDKLSNTKYFREAAEGYNAMEQGKVKSSTLAYLAPELLGNVTEISKSFSGRGVANVVDTVVASPVNFATRAIYGKSNPVGDFMADFADEMRETFTTEESKKQSETEFSFKKISDPKFWMTTIPEQIPQTLAFVKIGSLAKGGATKLFGTSTFAKIASLATGGTAMRAFESSGEAEETYKTARAQGMSDKEAVNASKEVFMNNMALAGLDAVQLAIALAPIGKGTGSIMSKILKEVASAGAGAITEGGEEVYQYHIQQNALGNKKSIVDRLADPQAQEAGFIGALMGVAFQVGGRIDQSVSEKQQKAYMDNVASKLPPEVQTEYGTAKTIEEKQAVLDRVAEENAPAITSAVQQVETEHKKSVEAVKEIFNSQQEPTITPEVQASIDQVKQKVETTREIRQKDEVEKNLEENIKGLEEDLADTQIKLAEIEEKLETVPEEEKAVLEEEKTVIEAEQKATADKIEEEYAKKTEKVVEEKTVEQKVIEEGYVKDFAEDKPQTVDKPVSTVETNAETDRQDQIALYRKKAQSAEKEGAIKLAQQFTKKADALEGIKKEKPTRAKDAPVQKQKEYAKTASSKSETKSPEKPESSEKSPEISENKPGDFNVGDEIAFHKIEKGKTVGVHDEKYTVKDFIDKGKKSEKIQIVNEDGKELWTTSISISKITPSEAKQEVGKVTEKSKKPKKVFVDTTPDKIVSIKETGLEGKTLTVEKGAFDGVPITDKDGNPIQRGKGVEAYEGQTDKAIQVMKQEFEEAVQNGQIPAKLYNFHSVLHAPWAVFSEDTKETARLHDDILGYYISGIGSKEENIASLLELTEKRKAIIDKSTKKQQEVVKPKTALEIHRETENGLRDGTATLEEYKTSFDAVVGNKDTIIEELSGKTKQELLGMIGRFTAAQYKNEIKKRVVDAVYNDMVDFYALGEAIQVVYGGGDFASQSVNAVRKIVDTATNENLQTFAERVAEARKRSAEYNESIKKSLENPETFEEFQTFVRVKGKKALNEEQTVLLEEIIADRQRERAKKQQEEKSTVTGVKADTDMTIQQTKHTKTGEDLFVVTMSDRVERDTYKELLSRAKKLGGWYSSFRGAGAIPGFQFKKMDDAQQFVSVGKGETVTTEKYAEKAEERKEKAGEKLLAMADTLEEKANEKLNAPRLANTARRASIASGMEADARADITLAQTMRNIGKAIQEKKAKFLDGITTKKEVQEFENILRNARYQETVGKTDKEKQELADKPYDNATVMKVPEDWYFPSITKKTIEKALLTSGIKRVAQGLAKQLKRRGDTDRLQAVTAGEANDMIEIVKFLGNDTAWFEQSSTESYSRFVRAGANSFPTLRTMLREYVTYRGEDLKEDKVKKLERDLIGKKVGVDFFPTPKSTAVQMVELADIEEGMTVLEPSAGNGNIAEAIREESGVNPDVAEISGELREVLEAKGFNVVENDFLQIETKYDRIVMNPPFSNNMDIEHVEHAYKLLNDDGKLVTIVGEGAFIRSGKRETAFREWLDSIGATVEPLPANTFKDVNLLATTGANARVVVITKTPTIAFQKAKGITLTTNILNSLEGKSTVSRPSEATQPVTAFKRTSTAQRVMQALGLDVVPSTVEEQMGVFAEIMERLKINIPVEVAYDIFTGERDAEFADGRGRAYGVFWKDKIWLSRSAVTKTTAIHEATHFAMTHPELFDVLKGFDMHGLYVAANGGKEYRARDMVRLQEVVTSRMEDFIQGHDMSRVPNVIRRFCERVAVILERIGRAFGYERDVIQSFIRIIAYDRSSRIQKVGIATNPRTYDEITEDYVNGMRVLDFGMADQIESIRDMELLFQRVYNRDTKGRFAEDNLIILDNIKSIQVKDINTDTDDFQRAARDVQSGIMSFTDTPILVEKIDGKYVVQDGNHRLVQYINGGATMVQVMTDKTLYDKLQNKIEENPLAFDEMLMFQKQSKINLNLTPQQQNLYQEALIIREDFSRGAITGKQAGQRIHSLMQRINKTLSPEQYKILYEETDNKSKLFFQKRKAVSVKNAGVTQEEFERLSSEEQNEILGVDTNEPQNTLEAIADEILDGKRKVRMREDIQAELKENLGKNIFKKITGGVFTSSLDEIVQEARDIDTPEATVSDLVDILRAKVELKEIMKAEQKTIRENAKFDRAKRLEKAKLLKEEKLILKEQQKILKEIHKDIVEQIMAKRYTLKQYVAMKQRGIKEGIKTIKSVHKDRVKQVTAIKDALFLEDAEVREILGRRDFRQMSDKDFQEFLEEMYGRGMQIQEIMQARAELLDTIQTRELKHVENLQKVLDLPTHIKDMNLEQLHFFDGVLQKYQQGDVFLGVRGQQMAPETDLGEIRTYREAREKLAKESGMSLTSETVSADYLDKYRWDSILVEKNPFYKVLVTTLNKAFFTADSNTISLERQFNRLIKDARKSRARLTGFKGKVEQFFIPTDDRIFAYMEAEDKTKIANSMTQEELAAALFMQKYYADAREHLVVHETMEKGRDNYITHIRRGFLEAWKQDGVAVAVSEIVKQAQQDEMTANILSGDKIKDILPLEKFFKFSMRRTGGLAPTKNIARAFVGYAKQFERKKSYDSVLAKIDIYTRVLTAEKKTKGGVEMDETLRQFVNTWVNTRKGRRAEPIWQTGSKLDWAVGAINTYMSIKFLGLNVATGLASHVGEQVANWYNMGEKKYALGIARLATRKGQEFVKKYENFTGRTPFDELFEQTKSVPERVSEFALFGLFQSGSVRANKQFLLGSLTANEWDSGELSVERLAELKIEMGRWRVVHETSSVMGATTFGKVGTRFKTWAYVMANRTAKDVAVVVEKLRSSDRKDVMHMRETHELIRVAVTGAFVTLLIASLGYDDDDLKPSKDDSLTEALFKKALRDLNSVFSALSPQTLIAVPVAIDWMVKLAQALTSLAQLEEYETSEKGEYREGDLKALNALPKIILPNIVQ